VQPVELQKARFRLDSDIFPVLESNSN